MEKQSKTVSFGEENSASILLGNETFKKGLNSVKQPRRRINAFDRERKKKRKKKKLRGKHAWHVPKVLMDATHRDISRNLGEGNGENIGYINGGKINFSQRRKFPLSYEKITILPNRQLFMLNPLRTIGIFSLPIIIFK